MRVWSLLVVLWVAAAADARYYHMAYAGFRKDDPTTEQPLPEGDYADGKDRMGILYRAPSIYQPSYYHHGKVKPIEESVEVETYPIEHYEHPAMEDPDPAPPPPTAAPAAPSEKRQQPYSYYYIGRKLWYIPLYFSLYFVIYVAALIIRAITRHKITFPDRLPAQAARALLDGFGTNSTTSKEQQEGLNQNAADINKILDDLFVKYT